MIAFTASATMTKLKIEIYNITKQIQSPRTPGRPNELEALTADLVGCMAFLRELEKLDETKGVEA